MTPALTLAASPRLPTPHSALGVRPSAPGTMGSQAARVSRRGRSARRRTGKTPGPQPPVPSGPAQLPPEEEAGLDSSPAALSPGSGCWTLTPRTAPEPRGETGATPPPPAPSAPARPDPARRQRLRLLRPCQSGRGSQPGAPGGGRAAPSPAPARRSRGRSSRRRPTRRSTGCTARSWWGRAAGPGPCGGRRPAGQGRGDRPGWAPAARASRRRDYLIVLPGEERGGGAGRPHPPAVQGRGGGHCSSLCPPPSPRPSPLSAPAAWSRGWGMWSRGPAKRGSHGRQRDGVGSSDRRGAFLRPPPTAPLIDPEQQRDFELNHI